MFPNQATEAAERNPGEPLAPLGALPTPGEVDAEALGVGSPFRGPPADSQVLSDVNKQRFLRWLRLLLFQLMLHIVEVGVTTCHPPRSCFGSQL